MIETGAPNMSLGGVLHALLGLETAQDLQGHPIAGSASLAARTLKVGCGGIHPKRSFDRVNLPLRQ